ncbi:MAG: cation diffusion facilitator family transporter [Rickettsiaceae bacterium]|nr:cation diffusion facilitator family transporter [Rickettsiaceae bacterium]
MKLENKKLLLKSSSYLSVVCGFVVFIIKLYGYLNTGSMSIFASLIDAGLDTTSSVLNMFALQFALTPPDENHRFGHEKIQDLAVFGQGVFFIASSIFVLFSAIMKLTHGKEVVNIESGLYVMMTTTIISILLVSYQTYVLSIAESNIIKADKLHYLTDLLTNITVMISLSISASYWFIDDVLGILIALYMGISAYKLMKEALRNLLDEECSEQDKEKIINILKKYKKRGEIKAIHDLKTRMAGQKYFIQFHVELDGNMKLYMSHEITENIERDIVKKLPGAEVIIHQDPTGIDEATPYRNELNVAN